MGLCQKHLHLHLKRVFIVSVHLGNDSPVDPEVALTAECEGNHRMCNTYLSKLLILFICIKCKTPEHSSKNSKNSECNYMNMYSILNLNINFETGTHDGQDGCDILDDLQLVYSLCRVYSVY